MKNKYLEVTLEKEYYHKCRNDVIININFVNETIVNQKHFENKNK